MQELNIIMRIWIFSEAGISVCDAGCSTAVQTIMMARKFPNSTFFAFDVSSDAVRQASTRAQQQGGVANLTFGVADGCDMPRDWSERFDVLVTWDVVHDVPHSSRFLREIRRVLKPGGMFLMVDVGLHSDPEDNKEFALSSLLYGCSMFHCMPVSLNFEGGEGLGAVWGIEKQEEYLKAAGFKNITLLQPNVPPGLDAHFAAYK